MKKVHSIWLEGDEERVKTEDAWEGENKERDKINDVKKKKKDPVNSARRMLGRVYKGWQFLFNLTLVMATGEAAMKRAVVFIALIGLTLGAKLDGLGHHDSDHSIEAGSQRFNIQAGSIRHTEFKAANTNNEAAVTGSYSWTAPNGQTYTVEYIADERGFRPVFRRGGAATTSTFSTGVNTHGSSLSLPIPSQNTRGSSLSLSTPSQSSVTGFGVGQAIISGSAAGSALSSGSSSGSGSQLSTNTGSAARPSLASRPIVSTSLPGISSGSVSTTSGTVFSTTITGGSVKDSGVYTSGSNADSGSFSTGSGSIQESSGTLPTSSLTVPSTTRVTNQITSNLISSSDAKEPSYNYVPPANPPSLSSVSTGFSSTGTESGFDSSGISGFTSSVSSSPSQTSGLRPVSSVTSTGLGTVSGLSIGDPVESIAVILAGQDIPSGVTRGQAAFQVNAVSSGAGGQAGSGGLTSGIYVPTVSSQSTDSFDSFGHSQVLDVQTGLNEISSDSSVGFSGTSSASSATPDDTVAVISVKEDNPVTTLFPATSTASTTTTFGSTSGFPSTSTATDAGITISVQPLSTVETSGSRFSAGQRPTVTSLPSRIISGPTGSLGNSFSTGARLPTTFTSSVDPVNSVAVILAGQGLPAGVKRGQAAFQIAAANRGTSTGVTGGSDSRFSAVGSDLGSSRPSASFGSGISSVSSSLGTGSNVGSTVTSGLGGSISSSIGSRQTASFGVSTGIGIGSSTSVGSAKPQLTSSGISSGSRGIAASGVSTSGKPSSGSRLISSSQGSLSSGILAGTQSSTSGSRFSVSSQPSSAFGEPGESVAVILAGQGIPPGVKRVQSPFQSSAAASARGSGSTGNIGSSFSSGFPASTSSSAGSRFSSASPAVVSSISSGGGVSSSSSAGVAGVSVLSGTSTGSGFSSGSGSSFTSGSTTGLSSGTTSNIGAPPKANFVSGATLSSDITSANVDSSGVFSSTSGSTGISSSGFSSETSSTGVTTPGESVAVILAGQGIPPGVTRSQAPFQTATNSVSTGPGNFDGGSIRTATGVLAGSGGSSGSQFATGIAGVVAGRESGSGTLSEIKVTTGLGGSIISGSRTTSNVPESNSFSGFIESGAPSSSITSGSGIGFQHSSISDSTSGTGLGTKTTGNLAGSRTSFGTLRPVTLTSSGGGNRLSGNRIPSRVAIRNRGTIPDVESVAVVLAKPGQL